MIVSHGQFEENWITGTLEEMIVIHVHIQLKNQLWIKIQKIEW